MRTRVALLVALGALLLALAPAAAQAARKPRYYVALGDSLSVGFQPDASGRGFTTRRGYADDLFKLEQHRFKGLRLVKFGCAGETTGSMLGDPASCSYGDLRNQITAATRFLRANRKRIAFVTLDIGANDIDNCTNGGTIDTNCLGAGVQAIKANLPVITRALRKAAGGKARMVAMTYYDPFLALWLRGDQNSQQTAQASVGLTQSVDSQLSQIYAAQRFKIAAVDTAFNTYVPFSQTTPGPGGSQIPIAVASICQLTYMCSPAPVGPNIHANDAGYSLIAQTFAAQLR